MTPQTAPLEINELHAEVAALINHQVVDAGRLRQIEVRIDRLLRTTSSPRLTCFGALFLISYGLGDRAKTENLIEQALDEPLLELGLLQNAIRVLTNFGSHDRARELIEVMVEAFPDSKRALDAAMIGSQIMQCPSKSIVFLDRLDKLTVNEAQPLHPRHRANLQLSLDLANQHGFDDGDLSSRLDAAVRAIRTVGQEVLRQNIVYLHDGSFVSQLYVDADAATCASINFDIADALVEKFDDPGSGVFSIACRPIADHAESIRMEIA